VKDPVPERMRKRRLRPRRKNRLQLLKGEKER